MQQRVKRYVVNVIQHNRHRVKLVSLIFDTNGDKMSGGCCHLSEVISWVKFWELAELAVLVN